jgi:tripartite-type tricarboxylate transporter receptor subunit TctC
MGKIIPACALLLGLASALQAQDYPSKPIRLIVATAPGGLMDVPGRLFADSVDRALGQRVLVENRGGAGGNLGAEAVAKAAPDGYTLGLIQLGNVAINPFIFKDMTFDPLADLAPVAPLTSSAIVIGISAKLPAANLAEFIALAKKDPGRINHGSAGPGTFPHLASELFSSMSGAKLTQVHYKGTGPALADLIGGQVQVVFAGLGVLRAQAAAGNVRILLVAQKTRLKSAPEVPTSEEAGLPGYEAITWFGIVAPRGTSDRVVATLNRQVHAMQDDPAVLKRLAEGGLDALKESPAEFGARIRRDYERYREVVKSAGLKPE